MRSLYVRCLLLVGLVALGACSSLPATHVLLPSPQAVPAMDKLAKLNGAVASIITVQGDERDLMVARGEPGTLSGKGLFDPRSDPSLAWSYDSLALIYYTDPAPAKIDVAKRLPFKDRYPVLVAAGAPERGLSCTQLDTELARAEALRLVARNAGATPYTTGDKLALHAEHTAGVIAGTILVLAAGAVGAGGNWSDLFHDSRTPGDWTVDLEAFRWAVSAIDERIDGLLKIKDQKFCAGRASLQADATDLQLWHTLAPLSETTGSGSSDAHARLARRTAVFDLLGPKPVVPPEPVQGPTASPSSLRPIEFLPDETNPQVIGTVQWYPGMNFVAAGMWKEIKAAGNARVATLVLTDVSAVLQCQVHCKGAADSADAEVTRIPYAEIVSVTVEHATLYASLVIKQRNGQLDSLSVMASVMVDRNKTESAGKLIQAKLMPAKNVEGSP